MTRTLTFILLCLLACSVNAQSQKAAAIEPYGQVSQGEIDLKQCSFEKDANAEVLFDKTRIYYKYETVVAEYHKRIKIFNDKGYDYAKVRIEYLGVHKDEAVSDLEAETINIKDGKVEYTPVDKANIFTQNVDKQTKAITFTFPNLKPGSIIEYKYKWSSVSAGDFPDWDFQGELPVRHSEFRAEFSHDYTFRYVWRVHQKMTTDTDYFTNGRNVNQGTTHIWALDSIRSLKDEPFMRPARENEQHILFQVTGYYEITWQRIVKMLLNDVDFGNELDPRINLPKEGPITDKIKALPTMDEKINYIYGLVKTSMKYNDKQGIFTDSEIKRAWIFKEGSAAEMNFIIYHFLRNSGIDVSLVLMNEEGKIDIDYSSPYQLNRVAVYVQADSAKYYVLDAAEKDGKYNQLPYYALNSNGLLINPADGSSRFITLENLAPVPEYISINAEITPDGKLGGTTQISSVSYDKQSISKKYKDGGEKKYIEDLSEGNNYLKISSVKMDNMEVDSLPLTQNIDFKLDELPGSDENYIYLNPNLFTGVHSNPFLSEERLSDVDFKYLGSLSISGRFKIPSGFKIDILPKSQMLLMPDRSIIFKRIVAEDDGYAAVHYTINYGRSYFKQDEYPSLREFYKKLFEMLNEQIVFKKT